MEHALFLWQLAFFNARRFYLAFVIVPIPLFALSHFIPESRKFTVWVNAGSQFACFIPYFATVVREGTTLGISLLSCHLSACGSLWGLAMCGIKANCSRFGWIFYCQAMGQALCIYGLALAFGEFRMLDSARIPELAAGETDILLIEEECAGDEKFIVNIAGYMAAH
jgi:hypothetical protein